jgi:hypothetical protein
MPRSPVPPGDRPSREGGLPFSSGEGGDAHAARTNGRCASDERELDAIAGRIASDLLVHSHLLAPGTIAGALSEAARPLGISAACIYLTDLEQRDLRAMPGSTGQFPGVLAIDSTIAGRAYRTISIHHSPAGDGRGGHRVWIPLIDGTERLGVLGLAVRDIGEGMLDRYRMLASLAGLMIVSKTSYSDTFAQTQRSREMAPQAEMVWAFLAHRTFATERVLISATVEPAYEVGGDAFDYSLMGDRLYASVFDAAGHDLAAGLLASVAVASCRNTRRSGGTLAGIAARADHAIARQFGDGRFVTALLCELDVATGQFSWIPCGHPPPLLIRGNKVIKELARRSQLPLGIGELGKSTGCSAYRGEPQGEAGAPVHTEWLEPGDRVLLYTDGVTEGRAADGTAFGERRLSDFIIRHSNAGMPAPETLRRLNMAIIEYQQGRLSDDATIVMAEWIPDDPERQLTP